MKRIGNSIISQLSKMESQITEMQMIHTRLVELFAGKKILIVLDDLWEDNDQFQLDELKKMLKVSEDSKVVVIVTTRNESIANDLRTVQPYKLALLSDDSCWTIRLPALDTPKASCRMQIAVQASAAGSGMLCAMHSHPLYVA
jgi:hypothetical protein